MTCSMYVRRRVFELLGLGWLPREVAVELGVSGATVRQWRAETGGVIRQPAADSGRYLDRWERYEIARLAGAGWSVRAIARKLDRAGSTVPRELRRNDRSRYPGRRIPGGGYQPERAHHMALTRRARLKVRKLARCPVLKQWVQQRLDEKYSPEQISGRLKLDFADDGDMQISHESIYQAIHVHPRGELKRQLRAHLRTSRTRSTAPLHPSTSWGDPRSGVDP